MVEVVLLWLVLAFAGAAWADEEKTPAKFSDTGRFYFYFQSGHAGVVDTRVAGDAKLDTPDGINVVLGAGGGYNITDHWGLELQGHGTEPDIRSQTYGKIKEFSNITVMPAVRFRYPLGDGRLVPYLTGGVGLSLNEVNDTGNPKIKVETERSSIVGAIAAGLEYFVAEDVAVGLEVHSFIYPAIDSSMVVRDQANRIILDDHDQVNLTSVAGLAHLRLFPGQSSAHGKRRLFFADRGPFDTDAVRVYLYGLAGHTQILDGDFGGNIEVVAPGDFNATLGGGLGVNVSRHWGYEVQLFNSEPNMNLSGVGKFAELSNFTVLPMVRFRWPLRGGRVVPFATAGVGVAFNKINDVRNDVDQFGVGAVKTPQVSVDETSVAGSVAVGVEYFLNHHVSIGLSVPFYLYPDWDTEVRGGTAFVGGAAGATHRSQTNFSSVGALLLIKAYLP
jgi:opacity protein-like surface antigen